MAGSSAGGLIALLEEPEEELQLHGLNKINQKVDQFWAEIADALPIMYRIIFSVVYLLQFSERLSENENFQGRGLASLVASKVHYFGCSLLFPTL